MNTATALESGSHVEPLTKDQIATFATAGYLVLPGFLPRPMIDGLKLEVDRWVDEGLRTRSLAACTHVQPPPVLELELGLHGWLISHPPLMAILHALMGSEFVFHHLHSDRHDAGHAGVNWHHDYEQYPQTNRSHRMIHVLHYLEGLNGTIGDLVLMPGSHNLITDKKALGLFGTEPLPGEVTIGRIPPGTAIIAHSGVFHARRPRPGGEGSPRYFIDCSYCQVGVRWPPAKVYWRAMLARARELGLDRGQWPELFAERHFYSHFGRASAFNQLNRGSLFERLLPEPTAPVELPRPHNEVSP